MKKTLFATAFAVAAMTCVPAFAQVTGQAAVSYDWGQVEVAGAEADANGMSVGGVIASPLSEGLSIQAGASYSDTNVAEGTFAGSVHLVGNVGEQARVGGFIGASEVADETAVTGGVEGQVYFDRVTLAGTVAYGTVDSLDVDVWGVESQARFFATDDFRIDGTLGWLSADTPLGDAEAWVIGVGAEARLNGPFSLFVDYSHTDLEDLDASADTVSLGLRYNFGTGSLKERDRTGASFGGASNLLSIAAF